MRPMLTLFLCVLFSFSLFACDPGERLDIDSEHFVFSTQIVTSDELAQFIEEKQDFALLISSETCSSCQDFKPILDEIIQDYQIKVYQIESGDNFPTTNSTVPYNYTPTFVLFHQGEILSKIDAVNHEDEVNSVNSFVKYLEKYVTIEMRKK